MTFTEYLIIVVYVTGYALGRMHGEKVKTDWVEMPLAFLFGAMWPLYFLLCLCAAIKNAASKTDA